MPYSIDNPPEKIKSMPKHAQEIFISAFNAALKQYEGDEGKANAVAYAAVKNKYKQDEKGNWVVKEGGEGSGNFGHEGRPGEVGGSGGGGGGGSVSDARKSFIDKKVSNAKDNWNTQVGERVRNEIMSANIPDRHLEYVKSIRVDDKALGKIADEQGFSGFGAGMYNPNSGTITLASSTATVHEIGHAVMQKEIFGKGRGGEVLNIYGACQKTGRGFVSDYAKTDGKEFFAESYSAYAKNPKGFERKNPPMAKFLKSIW